MIKIKTKVGVRGQIVIPKVIRESLGLTENKTVLLEVDEKTVRLVPSADKEIAKSWEEISKREGGDVSKKFVYGAL